MYVAFAILLLIHGFAHLVGLVGPWGLASSVAPQAKLGIPINIVIILAVLLTHSEVVTQ